MIKYIKNKIKEKQGLSSLEMVIGALVIVAVFAGMMDFINISNRMQSLSSTMSYVSKVLSIQGCITSGNPEAIYLDSSGKQLYDTDYIKTGKFVNANTLFNTVNEIMSSDGIESDEWRIYIDGALFTPGHTSKLYDFRERIPVRVEIDYTWETIGNLLPINNNLLSGTFNTSQEIVSVYKIRELDINDGFEYSE